MSKVDLWQASRGGRRWYGIFWEKMPIRAAPDEFYCDLIPVALAYQIDQTIRHKRAGSPGQDDMVGFPKIFSENM